MTKKGEKDYEVGYGKPPKHTRWKAGQPSPNPKGRPKQSVGDLAAVVERIMNEPLHSRGEGKEPALSTEEAVLRRIVVDAVRGDQRAFGLVIDWIKRYKLIVQPLPPEKRPQRGYLIVPRMATIEEWEAAYQARTDPGAWAALGKPDPFDR